jgi:hypothetical protein
MSRDTLKTIALGGSILILLLIQYFSLGRIVDVGDGIAHYQVARDAFQHPELFLNTWGRPFFTLLMSIPAQFGMHAIILINILFATLTAILLYQVAIAVGINNGWLAPLLLITSHSTWNTIFAGLTEPLFLLLTVYSALLIIQNKRKFAYFIFGTMILTRPESVIMVPTLFIVDVIHNRPRIKELINAIIWATSIPLLYTVIGVIMFNKDWLYLIRSTSNHVAGDIYGFGNLNHFYIKRLEITSNAIYLFSLLGIIIAIYRRYWILLITTTGGILIIVLHSILWTLGLLGSAGLTRMLSTALPFICLAAVYSLMFSKHKLLMQLGIVLILINHSTNFIKQFNYLNTKDSKQELAIDFLQKLQNKEQIQKNKWYVHWSFLRQVLEIELNDKKYPHLWDLKTLKPSTNLSVNDIIIHDNFTGNREGLTPIEWLKSDRRLSLIQTASDTKSGLQLMAFKVLNLTDTLLTWKKGDILNNNPRFKINRDSSLTIDTRVRPYKIIEQHISKNGTLSILLDFSSNAQATIQNNEKFTTINLPWKGDFNVEKGVFEIYIKGEEEVQLNEIKIIRF